MSTRRRSGRAVPGRERKPEAPGVAREKLVAKSGIRAANLCASAFYASIVAAICFLIPFFRGVSILGSGVAVILGIAGITWLTGVKGQWRGREPSTPVGRVAKNMGIRARWQGPMGVLIGLVIAGIWLLPLLEG